MPVWPLCSCNTELDPMTLIYTGDLDILEMYQNEVSTSMLPRSSNRTDKRTDRHTLTDMIECITTCTAFDAGDTQCQWTHQFHMLFWSSHDKLLNVMHPLPVSAVGSWSGPVGRWLKQTSVNNKLHCVSRKRTTITDWHSFVKVCPLRMMLYRMHWHLIAD